MIYNSKLRYRASEGSEGEDEALTSSTTKLSRSESEGEDEALASSTTRAVAKGGNERSSLTTKLSRSESEGEDEALTSLTTKLSRSESEGEDERSSLTSQRGFAALYITFLILAAVFAIAINISVLTYDEQKISKNIIKSNQVYYIAEAGIEDMLLRLVKKMNWSSPYSLDIGGGTTIVTTSDIIGGSRNLTSRGSILNRIKKLEIVYQISSEEVAFYYGAQIGEGGMEMGNGSQVLGNVYSNGSVFGGGAIENTIIVAGNGNKIEGLDIGQNAKAYSCEDCEIEGNLTYVIGGTLDDCDVEGSTEQQSEEIQKKDLPISESEINQWKQDAEAGGVIIGDYTISGKITESLGPKKITGELIIDNLATLNMTGTLWTLGGIRVDNGATVQLDQNSYGLLSGVLLTDDKIKIKPGTYLMGTEQQGSYLLILSTNNSLETLSPAIDVDNNAEAAIFYTTQGLIVLRNNIQIKEVTGYKVSLDNNAIISYEIGLENLEFTSGPGASWQVTSWKEVY